MGRWGERDVGGRGEGGGVGQSRSPPTQLPRQDSLQTQEGVGGRGCGGRELRFGVKFQMLPFNKLIIVFLSSIGSLGNFLQSEYVALFDVKRG